MKEMLKFILTNRNSKINDQTVKKFLIDCYAIKLTIKNLLIFNKSVILSLNLLCFNLELEMK